MTTESITIERAAYPSDVSDEEWALVVPYLTLMTDDATQRLVLDSARLAHPPLRTPYPPAQRSSCVTPRVARYISRLRH